MEMTNTNKMAFSKVAGSGFGTCDVFGICQRETSSSNPTVDICYIKSSLYIIVDFRIWIFYSLILFVVVERELLLEQVVRIV